jgi:hypothetical protein
MIENKIDVKTAESIVGDVYTVLSEEKGTILRDAKEFFALGIAAQHTRPLCLFLKSIRDTFHPAITG